MSSRMINILGAVAPGPTFVAHAIQPSNRQLTFAVVILFRLGDQTERKIMYMCDRIAIDYIVGYSRPIYRPI